MKQKVIVFIVASLVLSASYLWFTSPVEWQEGESKARVLPTTEVVEASLVTARKKMTLYSEVKAKWQTDIVAQVQGRVDFIDSRLEQGNKVKKGELLASFEPSRYQLSVEEAKARLLQAQAALAIAESKMAAAKRGWKLAGNKGKPTSSIVFKEPQVAQAKADVAAAQANLANKKLQLSFTKVYAPYDAIVAKRSIDPGEAIQNGQALLTLFNAGVREVAVALTEKQWQVLPERLTIDDIQVKAVSANTQQQQSIKVTGIRKAGFIDPLSRQRFIYLELSDGLPGMFVEVTLQGKRRSDAVQIPKTAMSPSGLVWYVDEQNRLGNWKPQILSANDSSIYVTATKNSSLRVVKYSHDGLKVGARVDAIEGAAL